MTNDITITVHVPEDAEFLKGVARVTICHAHLDHSLRMCIKSLAGLSAQDALEATEYEGSRTLRDRIRKLARMRLGEGQALLKVQALMKRCEDLTEQRNPLAHSVIALHHYSGSTSPIAMRWMADRSWESLPSADELNKLADALTATASELHHARLNGWLSEALQKRPLP